MRNPYATPIAVLGVPQAQWDAAKAALVTWLQAHPEVSSVNDATIRLLHPALADDRLYNELKAAIEAGR